MSDKLPPRLSDLHGKERLDALLARDADRREAFRSKQERRGPLEWLFDLLFRRP